MKRLKPNTKLLLAIKRKDAKRVKELLEQDADPNFKFDDSGYTSMHYAVTEGTPEILVLLHKFGGDIEMPCGETGGITELPLHMAIQRRNFDMVETCLKLGAKVNSLTSVGTMPMHYATRGDLKTVELLWNAGGSLSKVPGSRLDTPMHWVATVGTEETCRFFVKKGGDLNEPDSTGITPVQRGMKYPSWSESEFNYALFEYQKNDSYQDLGTEKVDFFIENGGDLNKPDNQGFTAMHIIAVAGNMQMLQACLNAGGNAKVKSYDKEVSPMVYAGRHKNYSNFLLLASKGLFPDIPISSFTSQVFGFSESQFTSSLLSFLLLSSDRTNSLSADQRKDLLQEYLKTSITGDLIKEIFSSTTFLQFIDEEKLFSIIKASLKHNIELTPDRAKNLLVLAERLANKGPEYVNLAIEAVNLFSFKEYDSITSGLNRKLGLKIAKEFLEDRENNGERQNEIPDMFEQVL